MLFPLFICYRVLSLSPPLSVRVFVPLCLSGNEKVLTFCPRDLCWDLRSYWLSKGSGTRIQSLALLLLLYILIEINVIFFFFPFFMYCLFTFLCVGVCNSFGRTLHFWTVVCLWVGAVRDCYFERDDYKRVYSRFWTLLEEILLPPGLSLLLLLILLSLCFICMISV